MSNKIIIIMNKESLLQKLNHILKTENVVNFSYRKKNGELRHARGTKKIDRIKSIDENAIPSGEGTPKTGVIAYFDLDKSAWRSFQEESLVSIETQESDDMFN
jgi:hypothetical protein